MHAIARHGEDAVDHRSHETHVLARALSSIALRASLQ